MLKFWILLFTIAVLQVSSLPTGKKNVYGPLCWGPGVWPHPEHCRLFTICHLKYEVKGQLYACPKDTGFSTKHQKCIEDDKVPACRMAVFNEDKLTGSSAILFPLSAGKPDVNLCYKNRSSTPFCLDHDALVVCGPREVYIGTVSCEHQSQVVGSGRCDQYTRSCVVDELPHLEVGSDVTQQPTTSPYVTPPPIATPPSPPAPINIEQLQNITAAVLEEIASSNLTLFTEDVINTTTTSTPPPTLPPVGEVSCKVPGLQCHDNTTIIDCPDDLSEPSFVMSCANIIQTTEENATGYCNPENPTCVLTVQNFLLNLEISSFNFGDQGVSSPEMEFAGIDEDYEGPELYDSDNLRESPDDFFGGLSWFRKVPKSRDLASGESNSNPREGKMRRNLENESVSSRGIQKPQVVTDGSRRVEALKGSRDFYGYFPRVKHPKSIQARSDVDDFDEFLAKCQQGGLYCFDNATLVACAGDLDSPTYAVQCYAEATSPNGRRLQAYCDQKSDSCVVNVLDAVEGDAGDDNSRNVEVITSTTAASVSHRRSASSSLLSTATSSWRGR